MAIPGSGTIKELTYFGRTTAHRGELVGPDLRGRMWIVLGSAYNAETDQTIVTVELPEVLQPEV